MQENKMIYTIVVLFLIFIVLPISYSAYRYIYMNIQQEKNETLKKEREKRVQELLPEIEEILQEMKAILSGEIVMEDEENWLKRYNYMESRHSNVTEIRAGVRANDIKLEDNVGYMDITYWVIYKNEEGETISGGAETIRMTIEKKEGDWVVIAGKAIKPYPKDGVH